MRDCFNIPFDRIFFVCMFLVGCLYVFRLYEFTVFMVHCETFSELVILNHKVNLNAIHIVLTPKYQNHIFLGPCQVPSLLCALFCVRSCEGIRFHVRMTGWVAVHWTASCDTAISGP